MPWCSWTFIQRQINLIGAVIGVNEQRAPAWGQGRAVYSVAVVLRRNEGLARHHIQHRLVLAPGEPQTWRKHTLHLLFVYGRHDIKSPENV